MKLWASTEASWAAEPAVGSSGSIPTASAESMSALHSKGSKTSLMMNAPAGALDPDTIREKI
jgi:hypothetical protein